MTLVTPSIQFWAKYHANSLISPHCHSIEDCSLIDMKLRLWACSESPTIQGHIANDIHYQLGQAEPLNTSSGDLPRDAKRY